MSTNLQIGIVGLPNVGKSTLFNAITKAGAEAANFPFVLLNLMWVLWKCRIIEFMIWQVYLIRKRRLHLPVLWILQGWWQEHRRGRAGEPVLSHIRETDAIAHVVRCFDDENITHVEGGINPVRDMGIINTELCLADLESVDKKRVKTAKLAQAGIKEAKAVLPIYERVFQVLQEGIPARTLI